jgi:hypothetical protein
MAASEQSSASASLASVMNNTASFLEKMHLLGGLGYILIGVAVVLVIVSMQPLAGNATMLEGIAAGSGTAGILIALVDKFIAYQFTKIKLTYVANISIKLIEATIPKDRTLDSALVEKNVASVLDALAGVHTVSNSNAATGMS